MLTNVCPTLFGVPIPPEHQKNIDRYTQELTDKLEQVALAALKDLKPARLAWGIGIGSTFATNRRTKGGPGRPRSAAARGAGSPTASSARSSSATPATA